MPTTLTKPFPSLSVSHDTILLSSLLPPPSSLSFLCQFPTGDRGFRVVVALALLHLLRHSSSLLLLRHSSIFPLKSKTLLPPSTLKLLTGSCMLPAKQMQSPGYPTSTKLPAPEHFRSKISAVHFPSCLHKTAFSFREKLYLRLCFFHLAQPYLINTSKRMAWSIRSNVDGNGLNPSSANNPGSGTRLIRVIQAFQTKLNARLKELRKDLPMKLLFFLVGFYCSTAFATMIGQTGDWDILSAALAVAVVEGIGALMYTASLPLVNKMRNLIIMFNYWKAGLSLGLFLDSFKY